METRFAFSFSPLEPRATGYGGYLRILVYPSLGYVLQYCSTVPNKPRGGRAKGEAVAAACCRVHASRVYVSTTIDLCSNNLVIRPESGLVSALTRTDARTESTGQTLARTRFW